jgi:excisionase family DNA binding protein
MPPCDDLRTLRVEQVAELLGVRPEAVRIWAREGDLVAMKWGGRLHFRPEAVEQFRESRSLRVPDIPRQIALFSSSRSPDGASPLDTAPGLEHNADTGERAMPLFYRVGKTRRKWRAPGGIKTVWTWVLRWRAPPETGLDKQLAIGRMSERMAERCRERWQAQLNGLGDEAEDQPASWQAFRDGYLAAAAVDLRPASLAIARQALARFELALHPRFLGSIGPAEIERYRVGRLGKVSRITVRKDFAHLRAAWSWAMRTGLADANPFARQWFSGRTEREDPDAIPPARLPAFLAALEGQSTWVQASIRLAALWGPRTGELAAIVRADVDFAARTLRIPVRRRSGRRTKEGRGKTLPLDGETLGLLQELSHRDGPMLWGPREKPFTTAAGMGGYTRTLGAIARAFLAQEGYRPADDHPLQFLRRTAETRLRAAGVPDWIVGAILGHGTRVGEACYNGLSADQIAARAREILGC